MAEIKLNTALMTNMELQDCLSRSGGTAVYTVKSTKSDQLYILKHISVPESQRQVDALLFTGAAADNDAAQAYYQQVVSDYQQELEQLESLANTPNLDSFRSYEIKPKEEGIGFDVYLLAEYRTTLEQYLLQTPMTQTGAVNLAMDLCSALQDLRNAGLIHRAVKPSNIYLNSQGHFMLGDMGLARIDELKYCSMPEGMLSPYSAPELFELMANVNETVDLYAVGLILYRIYNGNHAPLEDEKTSAKAADKLRITGTELPAPMFSDYEMAGIIQKACSFKPEERYQTPDEMKQALVDYMMRNQVGDTPITPPIVADEEPVAQDAAEEEVEPVQFAKAEEIDDAFKESFSPDNEMLNALIESVHRDIDGDYTDTDPDLVDDEDDKPNIPVRKKNHHARWLPTVLAVVLVLGIAAAAIWFFFIRVDTITITSIEEIEKTVNSLTIAIETQDDPSSFEVVCTDAYGNMSRQAYTGQPNTFTGLASGTQYTISVEGLDREKIAGAASIIASTKATTNVISLTMNRQTVSEIEISFIVDGEEPEEWTLSYGPTGQTPKTKIFSGHTVVLTGLDPDTEYTITLMDPSDIHLTGAVSVTGRTLPSVTITDIKAELANSVATLTWLYAGDAPESWNVTTTGTDGYSDKQTVTENTIVLENLKAGETYNILITSDSMLKAVSSSITPNALEIKELTAVRNDSGNLDIAWTCEATADDVQWLVVYTLKGENITGTVEQTGETALTLTDLLPDSTYTIEIQEANGKQVGGKTSIEVAIPAAEQFTSYGFNTAYVSTWIAPSKEDWTVNDLQTTRTSFAKDETIAFACQSMESLTDSDDVVTTLLVVRNASGEVVDHYSGEEVWNNMWTRKMYVGELLRTPQEPGDYTLEIYFNSQRVKTIDTIDFTITE